MERIPEPELMNGEEQAEAYAGADFSEPHDRFVALFDETFPGFEATGRVLDLGCGPADVTIRFARRHPGWSLDGLDGAPAMLQLGRRAVAEAGLTDRIRLVEGYLPGALVPEAAYAAVISNSLLHHLADPAVLWAAVRRYGRPGAPVFVMDLLRPENAEAAERLVHAHAAAAPEVLRHDFFHSLLAAYRPAEVEAQLAAAQLSDFGVRAVSDRHLIVQGRLPL